MNNSKISTPKRLKFYLSIAILFLMACGPQYDINQFLSYFQPQSAEIVDKQDENYFFSQDYFYSSWGENWEYDYEEPKTDSAQIVKEWTDYFKKFDAREVAEYLYANPKNEDVATFINRNPKTNEYFSYLNILNRPQDETDTSKRIIEVEPLLNNFNVTTDKFLKERFGYLYIKYSSDDEAIAFYKSQFLPIASNSTVAARARAWYAGALLRKNQNDEGFYEFAQVFDKYPHLRFSSDLSVRIYGLKFSEGMLKFCKNDHEKASVYALAGIQPYQDALGYIQKIIEIEPNHPMIEFLMAREINRNEYYYLKPEGWLAMEKEYFFDSNDDFKTKSEISKSYFSKLTNLGISASQKPKIKNPAFWITAASYCAFVDKNHKKSRELLENAKNLKPQNQSLQSQISLQDMMLLAKEYQMATPEMEQKLLPILSLLNERKNFRQSNAIVSTCKILAKMYDESIKKQMDFELASGGGWWSSCSKKKVKEDVWFSKSGIPFVRAKKTLFALLSTEKLAPKNRYHEINEYSKFVEDTTSAKYAKELLLFMEQPNPSEIDKKFISLLDKNYLTELLGRSYLREYNFAEAAKAFEQLPDSTWESGADEYYMDNYSYYLKRNPFFMGLYRESLADTSKRIPPAKFALKMDELSKKTDAESLYLLGCGTYNLSFWGNWWIMVHNGKSHSEITREPNYNSNPYFDLNADYYQLRTAKRYFEQALSKTNDKELQARITYSLALIEQAKFEFEYAQKEPTYKDFKGNWEAYEAATEKYRTIMEKKEREFFNNFTILKTRYNQTKFHQLLIDECSTYEHFVSGK